MGRREAARTQYEHTANRYPDAVDPVYNLGVMSWNDNDWRGAAAYFQETLRRDPNHPSAAAFYARALAKVKEKP
jgi:Tfp pilus assembly protein PilF